MRASVIVLVIAGAASAQAPAWVQKTLFPGARGVSLSPAIGYDQVRQRVLFASNATWQWDGKHWGRDPSVIQTAGEPFGYGFDPARRTVVCFTESGLRVWTGTSWSAVEQIGFGPSTAYVYSRAFAYDSQRRRAVLFGGHQAYYGPIDEMWEGDGVRWQRLVRTVLPPERQAAAMTYDARRGRVVLFGGGGDTGLLDDTWEWDGASWVERFPALRPPARTSHALAYDPARGRVVLFGGGNSSEALTDTWEWDGNTWTRCECAHTPGPHSAAMTWDAARGQIVLVGNSANEQSDTWAWDGVDWRMLAPDQSPDARAGIAMSYDAARQRIVMFGGLGLYSGLGAETWEWQGTRWERRLPAHSPSARIYHALAYDASRARTVLFGGIDAGYQLLGDTWEWNGADWELRTPATSPLPRELLAMAYDPVRGHVLLFGGHNPSFAFDTWEWDGDNWVQIVPLQSPTGRRGHAMACDTARGRVMLFGGEDAFSRALGDTWEWDGVTWTLASALGPPARYGHALAYDSQRQRAFLLGGRLDTYSVVGDAWEWDGVAWTASLGVPPLVDQAMAYDAARARVLLLRPDFQGGTWVYGATTPATTTAIGEGCPGRSGVPMLSTYGDPSLGAEGFAFDVNGAPAATPVFLLLSAGTTSIPLGSCVLRVDPTVAFAAIAGATGDTGFATFPVPVPGLQALAGATFHAQALAVDAEGIVLTRALSLVIGD